MPYGALIFWYWIIAIIWPSSGCSCASCEPSDLHGVNEDGDVRERLLLARPAEGLVEGELVAQAVGGARRAQALQRRQVHEVVARLGGHAQAARPLGQRPQTLGEHRLEGHRVQGQALIIGADAQHRVHQQVAAAAGGRQLHAETQAVPRWNTGGSTLKHRQLQAETQPAGSSMLKHKQLHAETQPAPCWNTASRQLHAETETAPQQPAGSRGHWQQPATR